MGQPSHHVKNSAAFINIVNSLKLEPEYLMISFDVVSLFMRVPILDAINLLGALFSEDSGLISTRPNHIFYISWTIF